MMTINRSRSISIIRKTLSQNEWQLRQQQQHNVTRNISTRCIFEKNKRRYLLNDYNNMLTNKKSFVTIQQKRYLHHHPLIIMNHHRCQENQPQQQYVQNNYMYKMSSNIKQQQQRTIFQSIFNIFRSDNDVNKTNPVIKYLQTIINENKLKLYQVDPSIGAANVGSQNNEEVTPHDPLAQMKDTDDNFTFTPQINLSSIKPHHISEALMFVSRYDMNHIKKEMEQIINEIDKMSMNHHDDDNNNAFDKLSILVEKLYEIQLPLQSIHNIASVMSQLNQNTTSQVKTAKQNTSDDKSWDDIISQVSDHMITLRKLVYEQHQYFEVMKSILNKGNNNEIMNNNNQFQIIQFLAQRTIQDYTNHHNRNNNNNNDGENNNSNHQHDIEQYQILLDAFEDTKTSIMEFDMNSSSLLTKQQRNMMLGYMYQYIGIQKELLKTMTTLHRQREVGDQEDEEKLETKLLQHVNEKQFNILLKDDGKLDYIHNLLQSVSDHITSILKQQTNSSSTTVAGSRTEQYSALQDMLLSTTSGKGNIMNDLSYTNIQKQSIIDKRTMFRFNRYITLNGAMNVLYLLSQDIFGVTVIEEKDVNIKQYYQWNENNNIRLFHVYDTGKRNSNTTSSDSKNEMNSSQSNYLGSFIMDPYEDENKLNRSFTMPFLLSSSSMQQQQQRPIVIMSLQLKPPTWNDINEPVYLSYDDCETLFHEIGHVYQFILSGQLKTKYNDDTKESSISNNTLMTINCGPEYLPFDFTEFLPKFMEHWLSEKSTITALIKMSRMEDEENVVTDDAIDALLRVQSIEKAYKIGRIAFHSALELYLFMKFDIKGTESMIHVQQRFAQEYIPYDLPHQDDITPLIEIFQANANEQQISMYRYLWCDCLAAYTFNRIKEEYMKINTNPNNEENNNELIKQELCDRIRQKLLNPGGSIDIDTFLHEFQISKDVTADALLERYNLLHYGKEDSS